MKARITAMLTAICLLMSVHVFAETLADSFTDAELVQMIQAEGYSAVTMVSDGMIKIKIDGSIYVLINQSDGDLQAYYAIGGGNLSYKDINEWNRTKRLSRAYLDSDNDPVLEADLLANGGLTRKHVTEFFRVFQTSVTHFRRFVTDASSN